MSQPVIKDTVTHCLQSTIAFVFAENIRPPAVIVWPERGISHYYY